jgi:hypothetical protein
MPTLLQDFEHGTNGTALTAGSGGNTAGSGDNFLDSVSIGSGGTLAFTSTSPIHGALSCLIATGATAAGTFMTWAASLGTQTVHWGRTYLSLSAAPAASDAFIQFQDSSLAWAAGIQVTTARQLAVQDHGFAIVHTLATVLATATVYRVEWQLVSGTSTGQVTVSLYAGDSLTALETYTSPASQAVGANCGAVLLGWTGAHANQAGVTVDDYALGTTGALGPSVQAITLADLAGAADSFTGIPLGSRQADTGAATEDLTVTIAQGITQADVAGAVDAITVLIGGAPAPVPGTVIKAASPAFIRSQMPRMHIQNLLTGKWVNRDVQGIVSPSVTWALNTADAFTCTLAPPRGEMMDASGNAVIVEWRDAIYLEESDEIKFGGICTQSTLTGPQWNITAMGFAGYPNGMPYEGPDFTRTNIDALDVVRYIWNWLQSQPGGNIGMELGSGKSGTLLGAQVAPGIVTTIARNVAAGSSVIWLGNANAFNRNVTITISGVPYTISGVIRNSSGVATGQVNLTAPLGEPHVIGDPVLQTSPVFTTLARAVAVNQNNIWLGDAASFASGEAIIISGDPYTINQVLTGSTGLATGNVTLTSSTRKAYASGSPVYQVRTVTPFQLLWYNSTDLGSELTSIQQEAVFDTREYHFWGDPATRNTVRHRLLFGVPRLGNRLTGLRFAEGENIVSPSTVTRDGLKYASNVVALGAGAGSAQVRSTAASAGTGRLRRTYVFTDQTVNTVSRLASKAQRVLASMQNIDTVTQVVVRNHPNAPFGSFAPGDDIPVMMASGWRNTIIWSRITAMTQDPTTDLMTLTLARSDSFTYMAQTGQAGTL